MSSLLLPLSLAWFLVPHVHYSYAYDLQYLNYNALRKRKYHLDALFLIKVYLGSKSCPSVLENVDPRVPAPYIWDYSLFIVCSSDKKLSFFQIRFNW
jgi:hypothetical protein